VRGAVGVLVLSISICAEDREEEQAEEDVVVMVGGLIPLAGAIDLGGEGFSGEEKIPSMFSTPKLSLVFSGRVIPVRLFGIRALLCR
jgi:hypothetical protein